MKQISTKTPSYQTRQPGLCRSSERTKTYWPRVFVLLTACAVNLPFVLQPFHMDDRLYLEVAENILQQPFLPYSFPIVFEGIEYSDAASGSHLPLTAYYLALVRFLTGSRSEWVFHLAFLVFPVLSALAFHDLVRRRLKFPVVASVLLLLSPGVYVMSHTIMTDVAQLSFWLAAIASFVRVCENPRSLGAKLTCALSLAAAAATSLISMGLLLLLFVYWFRQPTDHAPMQESYPKARQCRRRDLLLLTIPIVIWVGWFLKGYWIYDRFLLFNLSSYVLERGALNPNLLLEKTASFILSTGSVFIFPVLLWIVAPRGLTTVIAGLTFVVSCLALLLWNETWSVGHKLLFAAFFSSGTLVVGMMLNSIPRRKDRGSVDRVLFLLFWGIAAANALIFYHGAVRYTVLAIPGVVFVWMQTFELAFPNRKTAGVILTAAAGLALCYAATIASTDYRLARLYREAARAIAEDYGDDGQAIWFTSEWGFRYYLAEAGGRLLTQSGTEAKLGDLLVKPLDPTPWPTRFDWPANAVLIEQRILNDSGIIHLMGRSAHAGFYSTGWGILPFSFSTETERDRINIFRITVSYGKIVQSVVEICKRTFEKDSKVLVVSKGDQDLLDLLGSNYAHFPQSPQGGYAGYHPADSTEAIAHLKELRAQGANYIVFPDTSRWWLTYYAEFRDFLEANGQIILDLQGVIIAYSLSPEP